MGIGFYFLGTILNHPLIFEAFRIEQSSVYAGLFFVSLVLSPFFSIVSLGSLALSRRYEFEADKYSAHVFLKPQALIDALKKLSSDNLSHLTPHPWKVFLEYSHPPVLRRIEALRKLNI